MHYHLYFSISCLLRCHLSDSLSSTRKAIDAALSAYKIILDPATSEQYLKRDKTFQHIKAHMQNEIEKDSSKYPLAHGLVGIHDFCSEHGSHADISSFFHRLESKDIPGTTKYEVILYYFQFPQQQTKYQFYFIATLEAFFLMFEIFKVFLNDGLKIIDPRWEETIKMLRTKLPELRKKHHAHPMS